VTFPYSRSPDGIMHRTFATRPGLDFDRLVAAVAGTEGGGSLPVSPTHTRGAGTLASSSRRESGGSEGSRADVLSLIRSVSKKQSFNLGNLPIPLEEGEALPG